MNKKKETQNTKIADFYSNWGILPDDIVLLAEDAKEACYEADAESCYEEFEEFSYEADREVKKVREAHE